MVLIYPEITTPCIVGTGIGRTTCFVIMRSGLECSLGEKTCTIHRVWFHTCYSLVCALSVSIDVVFMTIQSGAETLIDICRQAISGLSH